MIGLLEPLGLAALASVAVPVVIHLVRRADHRLLPFAATRFLHERRYPRREWRIRRWPLLVLRVSLCAALSLLLAIPVWRAGHDAPVTAAARASAAAAAPMRRVAFATSSRLRQLDAELPRTTQLSIVVPEELDGLDAERLHLSHAVRWEIVPGQSPPTNPSPPVTSSPMSIAVRVDATGNAELPLAKALLSSWTASGMQVAIDTAPQSEPFAAQTDWLLWLGGRLSTPADAWVRHGGRVLLARDPTPSGMAVLTDASGTVLFRERSLGLGRLLSTPTALSIEAMPGLRQASTAERLQSLLSAPLTAPTRAHAADVMPAQAEESSAAAVPLTEYVALLAALLFLVERVWGPRQASQIP